jgi:hypothetical protein
LCPRCSSLSSLTEKKKQFFLELWEDLESRASKANPNKTLAGNMNIRHVASVTSSALTSGNDDDDGALFDETAGAYKRLRQKTEEMLVDLVVGNVKDELKAYIKMYMRPCVSAGWLLTCTQRELVLPR